MKPYRVSLGRDGWWQWCRREGGDSVFGGFETQLAAEMDAAKETGWPIVPAYIALAMLLRVPMRHAK